MCPKQPQSLWFWGGYEARCQASAQVVALRGRHTSWAAADYFPVVFYPARRTQSVFQEKLTCRISIGNRTQATSPRLRRRFSCLHILYEESLAETTYMYPNQIETSPSARDTPRQDRRSWLAA